MVFNELGFVSLRTHSLVCWRGGGTWSQSEINHASSSKSR